eukprot:m.456083 g.456083  ORF g.456083 m.456083 type:complete len:134 (+) comp20985_c0_seq1:644-1045(+)
MIDDSGHGSILADDIADEFEALEEIFPPGLTTTTTEFCRLGANVPACLIVVRTVPGIEVCLVVRLPESYPDAPASIEILQSRKLSITQAAALLDRCGNVCAEEVGNPVIFVVATAVQEFLDEVKTAVTVASAA